jgi:tRNA uridine 5-carboxymethylaminomethyl modification enzyme
MFTSRAEFRLHLRIDNADERLTPLAYRVGTINQADYDGFRKKQERISAISKFLLQNRLDPKSRSGQAIYARLGMMTGDRFTGAGPLTGAQLLKRPEITFDDLMEWVNEELGSSQVHPPGENLLSREEARRVETDFKYEGYLAQQEKQIERMKRAEARPIPDWFDYRRVSGLSREVVEKLTRVRPLTLGQASRVPGITPAAVSLVNIYIEIFQRQGIEQASI